MQSYWTELTDPASRNGSNYEGPKPNPTKLKTLARVQTSPPEYFGRSRRALTFSFPRSPP